MSVYVCMCRMAVDIKRDNGQTNTFSFIRTVTVGFGFAPNLLDPRHLTNVGALADFYHVIITASKEFHLALRIKFQKNYSNMGMKESNPIRRINKRFCDDRVEIVSLPSSSLGVYMLVYILTSSLGTRENILSDTFLFLINYLFRTKFFK